MHASSSRSPSANRRKWMRQYFAQQMPVDLIYGRRRIAVESGWISDVSRQGLGLRSAQLIRLPLGAPVTVATSVADKVVTVSGAVASSRHGAEVGVLVATPDAQGNLMELAAGVKTVAVSNPDDGRTCVAGKMSMAARHPIQWALNAGARRLDMKDVTELDSAGLGLLLLNHERHGLTIENCPTHVCRMIELTGLRRLCTSSCPRRAK